MVDDAHGLGVIGEHGGGLLDILDLVKRCAGLMARWVKALVPLAHS